jgi:Calcineurin-like phosphoesterase
VKLLITSDTHASDKARDAYRFGLFPWLKKQQEKYDADFTLILGDITENKDRHSSLLVNRLVEGLTSLRPPVFILKGNHDCTDPNTPFFKFLNAIDGLKFVINPTFNKTLGAAFIPHCADQATLDRACKQMPPKPDYVVAHATFTGARAETGATLSGLSASPIELLRPRLGVYSGDVHVPQRHGKVTYVGAPYHVRFGDNFTPRVLLVKDGQETDLHFDCPRKLTLTVRDADDITRNKELRRGDQVKLIIEMAREEAVEWQASKQRVLAACREGGLEVFGAELKINTMARRERVKLNDETNLRTPLEIMQAFCKAEGVASNIRAAGEELLR